ncbi:MAG: helix-turn-helix domain-containing protein [Oscillospiraceae bacterium]|nr:helix-turn-helix domain-containing protein [Oscillospiraceae bacterium]
MKPNIGENIKKLRNEKQVTQEQLAEHLSISYQAVSKWENNVTTPDIFLLPVIAEYFEVPIDEIFKVNMKGYKNKAARLFALYDYGDREHKKENFNKAEAEYEKLIAENKMDGEDMRLYGILNQFYAQVLNKKAEEMLKKSVEMGIERSEGQLMGLLRSQGRHEENIKKYEELMKNDPDNVRWWNLLASSHNDFDKKSDTVKKGLKKFPNDAGLLNRYAEICKNQGKYDEAIEYYKKSVEQNNEIGSSYYAMAFLYKDMEKYKESIQAWEEVIALHDRLGLPDEEIEMGKEWPKQEIAKLKMLIENNGE